ncbi:hypothetical protein RJ639_015252 [Escallonia herrerae]|uniref:Uncharacterized protein n=1 Tax=Escallonia herrerae TaxID=1293975 RepID=A0AA88VK87_9ASTE|nr:hypothetical protein RJ639_015252 [Escallonia herrerae]
MELPRKANNLLCCLCSATSATSHVVLGQFKTCVILLGGYLLFNSDPGFVSICGAVIAICGMSVYTSLNLSESRRTAGDQLPQQSFSVLKPKSTEDGTQESNWESSAMDETIHQKRHGLPEHARKRHVDCTNSWPANQIYLEQLEIEKSKRADLHPATSTQGKLL